MSDLISRADAIEAICNAQCELDVPHYPRCDQVKYCDEIKALLALPSADRPTNTPTDGDLISREEALKKLENALEDDSFIRVILKDIILSLPSAYRPTGEWIKPKEHEHMRECSNCQYEVPLDLSWEYEFCPLCGAYMIGGE